MNKVFWAWLILLIIAGKSYAAFEAEVLRFPVGARAIGMAQAQTAITSGLEAIYWNPAGLAKLWKKEVGFSCIDGLLDTNLSFLSYGQPTKKGYLAGGLTYLDGGEAIHYLPDGTTKNFCAQTDWVSSMAYGRQIRENWCIGAGVKIIRSTLAQRASATGWGMDLAWLYRKKGFNAGLVLANVGVGLKYIDKRDSLPSCLRFGVGYERQIKSGNNLILALDLAKYRDEDLALYAGLEYIYADLLCLRTGYQTVPEISQLTGGFGLKITNYQVDYAYCPFEDLSSAHRLSLKIILP